MIAERLLLDCREFEGERRTGIGRVLEALAIALSESDFAKIKFCWPQMMLILPFPFGS
jgi:hypothetical protein